VPIFYRSHQYYPFDDSLDIADPIIAFLHKLQEVQELTLRMEMDWDDIGYDGNRALLRLFRLPSLKLGFLKGVPISLLPLLGPNIQAVCIPRENSLSMEEPKFALEVPWDCNDAQAECGPRPASLKMSGPEDLELLMSPPFKNVNSNFFTPLRFVSVSKLFDWMSRTCHLHTLLKSSPHLSQFTIGMCQE
jgi:hypothetical protein